MFHLHRALRERRGKLGESSNWLGRKDDTKNAAPHTELRRCGSGRLPAATYGTRIEASRHAAQAASGAEGGAASGAASGAGHAKPSRFPCTGTPSRGRSMDVTEWAPRSRRPRPRSLAGSTLPRGGDHNSDGRLRETQAP